MGSRACLYPERPQPLRLAHIEAAVLRLPCIDRCTADAALPGHIIHGAPGFDLLQRSDDAALPYACAYPYRPPS